MEKKFNGSEKIGEIVSGFPGASNLFKENNIDFCCGGDRTLMTVLHQQHLNEEPFIDHLNMLYLDANKNKDQSVDWRESTFTDLINYVIKTHHVYLQKELPILSEFATKILRVHGPTHGDVLLKLHRLFHQMKTELEQHLIMEEEVVFPLITSQAWKKSPTRFRLLST